MLGFVMEHIYIAVSLLDLSKRSYICLYISIKHTNTPLGDEPLLSFTDYFTPNLNSYLSMSTNQKKVYSVVLLYVISLADYSYEQTRGDCFLRDNEADFGPLTLNGRTTVKRLFVSCCIFSFFAGHRRDSLILPLWSKVNVSPGN